MQFFADIFITIELETIYAQSNGREKNFIIDESSTMTATSGTLCTLRFL